MISPDAPLQEQQPIPPTAIALSFAALAVPVASGFLFREHSSQYELLLWLLALLPAFLHAYYRGWRGAATIMAGVMAAFAMLQVMFLASGKSLDSFGRSTELMVSLVSITIGIGWLAERLRSDQRRIQELALTDILTGLPNRRYLDIFLQMNVAAARRGRAVSVVLFDIDHFKRYNDQYGHAAGDEALKAVAQAIAAITRDMDLAGRWGGEEFLSILTDATAEGAARYARSVLERVAQIDLRQSLTLSAGVARFDASMAGADNLLEAADRALYAAKAAGRDHVSITHPV